MSAIKAQQPMLVAIMRAQEPDRIVSQPLPWRADVAVSVLIGLWSTFGETLGSHRRQAELDAKRLKRLLGPHKASSNKEALEAAQLLLSILQALGLPEPRMQASEAGEGGPT